MLKQGKSQASFKHNVETEMHAGKPQDQALAIAYRVKRKFAHKKMAKGGMIENEKLNPMHEPEHGAENLLHKEYALSHKKQSHGELEHPDEIKSDFNPKSEHAENYRKYSTKGMYPQSHDQGQMYAKGGEVASDYPYSDHVHTHSPVSGHDLGDQPEPFKENEEGYPYEEDKIHTGYEDYDTRYYKGGPVKHVAMDYESKPMPEPHQMHEDHPEHYRELAYGGSYDDGGNVDIDHDKAQQVSDSFKHVFHRGGVADRVMRKHMAQGEYLDPHYNYLSENDSYPDEDNKEHDVLDFDVDSPENKVMKRRALIRSILSDEHHGSDYKDYKITK